MTVFIDYSIGPVQTFVAQSRRTRDLWGSSYLLSFLSGHAMLGAVQAGGRVVRPRVDDDLVFLWISGQRSGDPPTVGSLPNRFQIEIQDETQVYPVVKATTEALYSAWNRVHNAVFEKFIRDVVSYGNDTEQIWDRQTSHFWEILWTSSTCSNSDSLARRKHWRTHHPTEEPGDKCTVMHDYQEISGFCRAGGKDQARLQGLFWGELRKKLRPSELRDDERLCSIALVKRLFPLVAKEAVGWELDTSRWPSTVFIAAVPWIRNAVSYAPEKAEHFATLVRDIGGSTTFIEKRPPFDSGAESRNRLTAIDENYFHKAFIRNPRLCPLESSAEYSKEEARSKLLEALDAIQETALNDGTTIGPASNYYALLLADGDRVGNRLIPELGNDAVGTGLARFSKLVPSIVRKHDGVLVYGGGDDVLAMLPVPEALQCAQELSEEYNKAFGGADVATLSVGIAFSHIRFPLTSALRQVHALLDEKAKEYNGRNSLAAAVCNRGGTICEWTTTWLRNSLFKPEGKVKSVELVDKLSQRLAGEAYQSGVSASFLYRLRQVLGLLSDQPHWRPGDQFKLPAGVDGYKFIRAEVIRMFVDPEQQSKQELVDETAQLVWDLLPVARNFTTSDTDALPVTIDGLLLARFLSTGGREEDR